MTVIEFIIKQAAKHDISVQQWGDDAFRVQVWDDNFNGIVGIETLVTMIENAEARNV